MIQNKNKGVFGLIIMLVSGFCLEIQGATPRIPSALWAKTRPATALITLRVCAAYSQVHSSKAGDLQKDWWILRPMPKITDDQWRQKSSDFLEIAILHQTLRGDLYYHGEPCHTRVSILNRARKNFLKDNGYSFGPGCLLEKGLTADSEINRQRGLEWGNVSALELDGASDEAERKLNNQLIRAKLLELASTSKSPCASNPENLVHHIFPELFEKTVPIARSVEQIDIERSGIPGSHVFWGFLLPAVTHRWSTYGQLAKLSDQYKKECLVVGLTRKELALKVLDSTLNKKIFFAQAVASSKRFPGMKVIVNDPKAGERFIAACEQAWEYWNIEKVGRNDTG